MLGYQVLKTLPGFPDGAQKLHCVWPRLTCESTKKYNQDHAFGLNFAMSSCIGRCGIFDPFLDFVSRRKKFHMRADVNLARVETGPSVPAEGFCWTPFAGVSK